MNSFYKKYSRTTICVVGLGYIGGPLSYQFAEKYNVIGFDKDLKRVKKLNRDIDQNKQISKKQFKKVKKNILITSNVNKISHANVYIIAVPTPIQNNKKPDLKYIKSASINVAKKLNKGDIIVFESTVYPGLTNSFCLELLERYSGLKAEKDFYIGYSPERINPGDIKHRIDNTDKIISANSNKVLKYLKHLYSSVIKAKMHVAPTIEAAEAAKIIENTQRDVNVALINEFSIICNKMGLSATEVLKLANTKWNFLNFKPGLVGGHCIGVDPYYLSFRAKQLKHKPVLIDAGRSVNDNMSNRIAKLIKKKIYHIKNPKVLILGFAFKENCGDSRNTKVNDLYINLKKKIKHIDIFDPIVDKQEVYKNYKLNLLKSFPKIKYDLVFIAVAHDYFLKIGTKKIIKICKEKSNIIDFKNLFKDSSFNTL